MSEQITPGMLKNLYEKGENISSFLKEKTNSSTNSEQIIEVSYDLQSGSYIKQMRDSDFYALKRKYAKTLVDTILSLCKPDSILEAGIGEATTLSGVIETLGEADINSYGFDISWSRIAYAKKWLSENGLNDVNLCTASLFNLPYRENSIDVVYTSHSMEPNGGNEARILAELYRVTGRYLILLEPGYEFANSEGKQRMQRLGYVKDIKKHCLDLGFKVLHHDLFALSTRDTNPTALTIIEKSKTRQNTSKKDVLACPKYKTDLIETADFFYSHEALTAYPKLDSIPCLRIENGIIATKLTDFMPIGEASSRSKG